MYGQTGIFLQCENGELDALQFRYELGQLAQQLTGRFGDAEPVFSFEECEWAWRGYVTDVHLDRLQNLLELKQQYNVLLLSNTNPFMMHWADSQAFSGDGHPISYYFHRTYYSFLMHDYKPSATIFQKVLTDAGIRPEESLFLDDGPANVEAARQLGINGLVVPKNEDWMPKLRQYLRTLVVLLSFVFLPLLTRAQKGGAWTSDSLVARALRLEGIRTTDGNDVRLLMSGHDKFEDLFTEVRRATSFIHMEYFNFRNDSINSLLINLLNQKAREGVEVRVMYDAFGNSSNNRPIKGSQHDSIAALGIDLQKFDPIVFPWVNHIIPRDHRKIVVIDGRVAYTGGMNVADYYITGIEEIGPWRDMHMHIEGPAVNELHEIFAAMWMKQTGELLTGEKYFPTHANEGTMRTAIVDRAPHISNASIRHLYVSMLDNAHERVRIINPYFVPTHSVRQAIKRAINRGVDVQIMLSEKSDIPLTPDASHYVGNSLMKRGASVYLFQAGFHHTKLMIVDDRFCTVGSSNLDSRSLRCDYEVNTVIFDQSVTDELVRMFETDKQQSAHMTPGYWQTKSVGKRFVAWFGNLLTPFL